MNQDSVKVAILEQAKNIADLREELRREKEHHCALESQLEFLEQNMKKAPASEESDGDNTENSPPTISPG